MVSWTEDDAGAGSDAGCHFAIKNAKASALKYAILFIKFQLPFHLAQKAQKQENTIIVEYINSVIPSTYYYILNKILSLYFYFFSV